MSTSKKAIVISLDFDNCLYFVLFFSDRGVTKNLFVSVQKNKLGLQYFFPSERWASERAPRSENENW